MAGGSESFNLERYSRTASERFNLEGMRFGRLLVEGLTDQRNDQKRVWKCICDCGATVLASGKLLRAGKTKSCGCLRSDVARKRMTKHGAKEAPEYSSWRGMHERCNNQKHVGFEYYGALGVKVCDRWSEFSLFLEDMGPRPPGKSIDRYPDPHGNYEPGNCRWATASEQQKNKRKTTGVK